MEALHEQEKINTQLQQEVLQEHAIEKERVLQKQAHIEDKMEALHQQIQILCQKQVEIETQLTNKNKTTVSAKRRPNLLGITRQKSLNPQLNYFIKKVVKLEKE